MLFVDFNFIFNSSMRNKTRCWGGQFISIDFPLILTTVDVESAIEGADEKNDVASSSKNFEFDKSSSSFGWCGENCGKKKQKEDETRH